VQARFLELGFPSIEPNDGGLAVEPSLSNCCRAVIAGVDQGGIGFGDVGSARDCCFSGIVADSSELWNHHLCAPWGPPVPPGMDYVAGVA
jgi:hypothetical protein